MVRALCAFCLCIIFYSCITEDEFNPNGIKVSVLLKDSSGVEKYVFNNEEEFTVTFTLLNNSGKGLKYVSSPPLVVYNIFKDDSIISSSTDEMDYIQSYTISKLDNGENIEDKWSGPNSMGRKESGSIIQLEKGFYLIEVNHASFFEEYKVPKADLIQIEIVDKDN